MKLYSNSHERMYFPWMERNETKGVDRSKGEADVREFERNGGKDRLSCNYIKTYSRSQLSHSPSPPCAGHKVESCIYN